MANEQDEAKRLWQNLKSETDISQEMKNATEDQKLNWHHQENDPGHVHGNAYTAAVQNEQDAARVNLNQVRVPEMTAEQREAVMSEIAKNVQTLDQQIQQSQKAKQDLQQQH